MSLPALTVGSAAQLAASHCSNEWTLNPQSAARNTHLCPRQPYYWPSTPNFLWQQLTIFSSEYYRVLTGTHSPTPEGWKAELVWAPRVWITCSRLLLSSSPAWNQTNDLWVTSLRPYHYATEPTGSFCLQSEDDKYLFWTIPSQKKQPRHQVKSGSQPNIF